MPVSCPSIPVARNAIVGSSYLLCTTLTRQVQWKTNVLAWGGHKTSPETEKRPELYRYHRAWYKHRANKSLLNAAELQSS